MATLPCFVWQKTGATPTKDQFRSHKLLATPSDFLAGFDLPSREKNSLRTVRNAADVPCHSFFTHPTANSRTSPA
jgi:hypothetical protein